MTTVPTPARLREASAACAMWCETHDHLGGVCISKSSRVDFTTDAEYRAWRAGAADVLLARSAEDGVDVTVSIAGLGALEMTVNGAEQLAYAILRAVSLAKADIIVTTARTVGVAIPAPRGNADDTIPGGAA